VRSEGSFAHQIELMSTATIVIASHGNALGNAFWLPDHALVIEAQSYGQKGNLWFPLTYAVGNESHPLYYRTVSCTNTNDPCYVGNGEQKDQDFRIDLKKLSKHILKYVDYHQRMSVLNESDWDAIPIHGGSFIPQE
jgi:capsular polysaccharide biosynthesis protein